MNRRITRDVLLRKFKLERCYRPPVLLRHPEWNLPQDLAPLVARLLRLRPEFFFLQIGAFDGLENDPVAPLVREFGIGGIVVEPQPAAAAALRANYAPFPQVAVVNAAIADADGDREFFTASDASIQQASLSRSHLVSHGVSADRIAAIRVCCTTVANLLREHGRERCDLIQIDAEGWDHHIVRSINYPSVQPSIVRFEHHHMSNADADACLELLASYGFRFIADQWDVMAVRDT